jgi:hypothetical protein
LKAKLLIRDCPVRDNISVGKIGIFVNSPYGTGWEI